MRKESNFYSPVEIKIKGNKFHTEGIFARRQKVFCCSYSTCNCSCIISLLHSFVIARYSLLYCVGALVWATFVKKPLKLRKYVLKLFPSAEIKFLPF